MKVSNTIYRYIVCLLSAVASITALADNNISISTVSDIPGKEVEVCVELENADAISGMQMEMNLPAELKYVQNSALLSSVRSDNHVIAASSVNNKLNVVIYSLEKNIIKGTEGKLFSFRLALGKEPQTYPLEAQVKLVAPSGETVACNVNAGSVTILAPKITIDKEYIDFGHVPIGGNYSESVTIQNTGTAELIVEGIDFTHEYFSAGNTSFTLAPESSRILAITYKPEGRHSSENAVLISSNAVNGLQEIPVLSDAFAVNEIHTSSASGISDTEVTIDVVMNNMDMINGVQCSYTLPEALEYVMGSAVLSERTGSHKIAASVKGNTLNVLVYSTSGEDIKGNDGLLFSFKLKLTGSSGTYVLHPDNVVLSMEGQQNVLSAVYDGMVTIESPSISLPNRLELPQASLLTGAKGQCSVRNTSNIPLTITSVSCTEQGFSVSNEMPLTVLPNSEETLEICFMAESAGTYSSIMNIYSNDPDNRVRQIEVSANLYEPNTISVSQEQATDYTFTVSMDNYSEITGVQMDIDLDGITAEDIALVPSGRITGFSCVHKRIGSVCRVIIYSISDVKNIEGNEGELFRLLCKNVTSVSDGAKVVAENVVLSGAGTENHLTPGSILECNISRIAQEYTPGDVNGDGNILLNDATMIINYVIGKPQSNFNADAADYNGDGKILLNDATMIINKIIGK